LTSANENGWLADYEHNWAHLGLAEEGLIGIDELPIPFYTVHEAVENVVEGAEGKADA